MMNLRPKTTLEKEVVGVLNTVSKISELLKSLSQFISHDGSGFDESRLSFVKDTLYKIWTEEWTSSRHSVVSAFLKSRIGIRRSSPSDREKGLFDLQTEVRAFLSSDTTEATVLSVRYRKIHHSPIKVCLLIPKPFHGLTLFN
jgi:hypothetical protein